MALLSQHGGRMSQTDIQCALGLPAHLVAEKLLEIEDDGLVERRWISEDYTFAVERTG